MARASRSQRAPRGGIAPQRYEHSQDAVARPEIGAAPRFRSKAPPATYRYDSSLAPALDWDTNPARETVAFLLVCVEEAAALPAPHDFPEPRELKGADGAVLLRVGGLQDAVAALKRMQAPFLNWAGKAERQSFEVPTLPLFVHERLSTPAIVKTLEDHRRRPDQGEMDALFGDPRMPLSQQVNAYQHRNKLGEPADPGGFAGGDELAAAVRGVGRAGADDLHRPALWGEVRLEFPAVRA